MNALKGTVNEHDRQRTYKHKIEACLHNHRCSGRAISCTYYGVFWFLAQVTWHAELMRHIISSVACPAVPYFSTLSYKWHSFQTKNIEHVSFDSQKLLF
jgi:hypothetical protein